MYGLPYQTVPRVLATIEAVLIPAPERVCLFGYANVPWIKSHQRLIDEPALPGPAERLAQYLAGTQPEVSSFDGKIEGFCADWLPCNSRTYKSALAASMASRKATGEACDVTGT